MAFALHPAGNPAEEVRRIGCEQLTLAIRHLSTSQERTPSVHEARKCLKRTRALLRFARPALGERAYTRHNRRLRDISRSLSGARDWQAMLECLETLEKRFGKNWNAGIVGALRAGFQGQEQRAETLLTRGALQEAERRLEKAHRRFARLEFRSGKLSVGTGTGPTYARAQKQFHEACRIGESSAFHEWRKGAQHHWRQMQLLVAAWPDEMAVRIAKARALSQCLGEDHDLHILLGHVGGAGSDLGSWNDLERFYDGCIEQQYALRMAARAHGRLLFTERPAAFRRRLSGYWLVASDRYAQGARFRGQPGAEATVVPFRAAPGDAAQTPSPVADAD